MAANQDSPAQPSLSDELAIEEYKRLTGLIGDIEKQMVQIASGAVAVSVTILTVLFNLLLSDVPPVSALTAYVALAPCFVFIPAFFVLVAHRNELCRVVSYLRIFYEEKLDRSGWEGRLSLFRGKARGQEAHGHMPYVFWAMVVPTIFIFCKSLASADAICAHYWVAVVPVLFLLYLHWKYHDLLATDYERYLSVWQGMAKPHARADARERAA